MSNSNGSESKAPSALELLHNEFTKSGGKAPAKKEQQDLIAAWRKAEAARKVAEENLAKAQKAVSDAAAQIVRKCTGKRNAVIDGVTYVPMSRGDTVFFRRLGGEDALELG